MKIIHLSNVTNYKTGGGIFEVVSNVVKSMDPLDNVTDCYFVKWYNFPYLLLFKKRSDLIIHRHGLWTINSVLLLFLHMIFKIPFVLHPHGLYSPIRNQKSKFQKKIFFNLIEKHLFKSAKCVIACSENEKQMFIDEKIEFSRIFVLRNGIEESFFNKRNQEKKIKNNICYFGQIIPVKNIKDPIKVIHALKSGLMFKIAGYGDVQYENDLKKLVDELGLNDQISFMGPLYGDKRIELYDECDIFILPSYNENFGIVVLEALSRGCKVITTTGTPWKDIALKNLYIYEPNDLDKLKEIIENLMSQDGIEDNSEELEQYRWPSIVKELIKIYQNN
tara:strand:- start:513 stop:1514 length:1002 start_codon:yes stop_codon:yes gene_type:complete